MGVEMPSMALARFGTSRRHLDEALRGLLAALDEVEALAADPRPWKPEARVAWDDAVQARLGDLTQISELVEHARNVMFKLEQEMPRAAGTGVEETVLLLARCAEQYLRMSEPIGFAPVPEAAQQARDAAGDVVPLGPEHALPDGLIRINR